MVGAVIRLNKAPSAKWYLVNSLYTTGKERGLAKLLEIEPTQAADV